MTRKDLLHIALPPGIVFAVHLIGIYLFDAYSVFPAFDIPMHFLGGVSIGLSAVIGYKTLVRTKYMHPIPFLLLLFLVTAITVLAAVVWEFAEFAADTYLGTRMQPSLPDTMLDLFLGMCGGAVSGALWGRG